MWPASSSGSPSTAWPTCRRGAQECVFWELDPVARSRADAAGEARSEKEAWLSHVLLEWGSCGRVAYVDGEPAGLRALRAAGVLPWLRQPAHRADQRGRRPARDGVRRPGATPAGLGRVLMQAMAKDLLKRGDIRAVETFGVSANSATTTACCRPSSWSASASRPTASHPAHPRMRLELKSVLTWKEEVEAALERLVGAVRPAKVRPAAQSQFLPGRMCHGDGVRSVERRI